ncbi:MAG: carbohydrate ABC transporter permease [Spirochaetaceae bacterium]|nr:MAG: carbohydrate ABC transporter permease [Spirochaetaceae bacterium]
MKWRKRGQPPTIIITVVLLLFLLFPFFVMVSTMLKSSQEVYTLPPTWIPQQLHLSNFITVWSEFELFIFFKSSIIIAVGATIFNTLLTVPAAYAVARLRFIGRKFILYLFLVIQMFSPVIVIISLFKIMVGLNLLDTYFSLIIANTVFTIAFTIWMMNGYFKSIPVEIEEAALIDGCSRVQTITRIMIPIAVPGLVTAMIYTFIYAWNEFLFGLTFIQSRPKMPLVLALYNFVGRWTTQWELLTTAAFLAIIPVLVLFYVIERRLVAGLAGGAVKE